MIYYYCSCVVKCRQTNAHDSWTCSEKTGLKINCLVFSVIKIYNWNTIFKWVWKSYHDFICCLIACTLQPKIRRKFNSEQKKKKENKPKMKRKEKKNNTNWALVIENSELILSFLWLLLVANAFYFVTENVLVFSSLDRVRLICVGCLCVDMFGYAQ